MFYKRHTQRNRERAEILKKLNQLDLSRKREREQVRKRKSVEFLVRSNQKGKSKF